MEYSILARTFDHYSNEDLHIMAQGSVAVNGGNFPIANVVMKLVQDQLYSLSHGVEWYIGFLTTLFCSFEKPIGEYMQKGGGRQDPLLPEYMAERIMDRIRETLHSSLVEKLQFVSIPWQLDVGRFAMHHAVDMVGKYQMMARALPLESVVPEANVILPGKPPERGRDASEVSTQGKYFFKWRGDMEEDPEPDARELAKRGAMGELMAQSIAKAGTFNIVDIVQGGFIQIYPMEWSMPQYTYVRRTAAGFYGRIALILVELLRASLQTSFITFIRREGALTA